MNFYEEDVNSEFGTDDAIDIYLGGEYYASSSWIIRAGVFMMQSTMPELDTNSSADILSFKIDRYGASFGLGNITSAGETTYGVMFIYGKGETVTNDMFSDLHNPEYTTIDVNHYMIAFFVSGSVDFSKM